MKYRDSGINHRKLSSVQGSYSVWDNQQDGKLLDEYGEDFRWDEIFGEIPSRFVRWESFDEPETEENNLLPGYAYPIFPFLEHAPRDFTNDSYNTLAKYFGLEADEMIPSAKLVELYSFREAVFTQLSRQAELCAELDAEMIGVLKVFWYETDRVILTNKKEVSQSEDLRRKLIYGVRDLTNCITGGISEQKLFEKHGSLFRDFTCTPEEIIDSVEIGLKAILQKKEVIITHSIQLEERLLITEDLIRWALTSQAMLDPEKYKELASNRDEEDKPDEKPSDHRDWIEKEYQENIKNFKTDDEWAEEAAKKFQINFKTRDTPSSTSMKRYAKYKGRN